MYACLKSLIEISGQTNFPLWDLENTFFLLKSWHSDLKTHELRSRVTRCVCKKVAQNVAQSIFRDN
jgi:hypothetical protein